MTTSTPKPPRHKMALLTWVGAWGAITLILQLLSPFMATWPLPLRTLLISVLMVVALTWVVIPALTRLFAAWLAPAASDSRVVSFPRGEATEGRARAGQPV